MSTWECNTTTNRSDNPLPIPPPPPYHLTQPNAYCSAASTVPNAT
jgi:hypothetical protein